MEESTRKLKVEIWSDIVCPFCYIGKRNFEKALEEFSAAENVEIKWRTYLLDPDSPAVSDHDLHRHLIEKKAITPDQAHAMVEKVTSMGREAGIEFRMDQVQVANSRTAHQLVQYAATMGKAAQVTEFLFKAYFTEGKNISDHETLIEIGIQAGLDQQEIKRVLQERPFSHTIEKDLYEAHLVDVRGVPFFLFNGKMAVPGALSSDIFLRVLQRVWDKEK